MSKFNARQIETWFNGQINSLKEQLKVATTKQQKKTLNRYLQIFLNVKTYIETDSKVIITPIYKGFKELVEATERQLETIDRLEAPHIEKENFKLTVEYMQYILEIIETKKRGH